MSVFLRYKQHHAVMENNTNEIPCKNFHQWNGIVPVIKGEIHSIQYPDLINKPCDCGRMIWDEGMCNCPMVQHWEAKPKVAN